MPLNMNFEDDSMVTARYSEHYSVTPENDFEKEIVNVCKELAETLIRKNRDYGDSYRKLKEEYGKTYLEIRLSEKLNRLKRLNKNPAMVNDEGTIDTKFDFAGYSVLDIADERVNG
jgi:Nucleotide modification associated domain 1